MVHETRSGQSLLRRFFVYGLLGGTLVTLLSYYGTTILGLPFPPEAIFQVLIAPVPASIESIVVETFHEQAKYSVFVIASVIYSVFYGLIGVLLGLLYGTTQRNNSGVIIVGTIVPTLVGLGLQAELAARASNASSIYGWSTAVFLGLGVNALYTGLFVYHVRSGFLAGMKSSGTVGRTVSSVSRRRFLKMAIIVTVLLGIASVASGIGLSLLPRRSSILSYTPIPINSKPVEVDFAGLPAIFQDTRIRDLVESEVTDNSIFYRVDMDPILPRLYFGFWSLRIFGKVYNPLIIDKNDLLQLPTIDEYATLECVSNTINIPGALISTAKWTGVTLATLLSRAAVTSGAKFVVFRCADGYSVGIPIDRALLPHALLAYKMNDELLPNEHGFPLRAIVPGKYGMMNAKWITEIEVVDHIYLGYWQERGWSNDAEIKTTSIICYPRPQAHVTSSVPIAGIAFAGDRGISEVEVSVDGGSTWNKAILKEPRSPNSWVLWAYEWTPTDKGAVTIVVRAYDGTGGVQDSKETLPFPDGASGYNYTLVTVT